MSTINQHPSEEPKRPSISSTLMTVSVSLSFQLLVEQTSLEIVNRLLHFKSSELLIYWLFEN